MSLRWEYMVLDVNVASFFTGPDLDGDAFTSRLNELGAEGWELASTNSMEAGRGRTLDLACILKRPRS